MIDYVETLRVHGSDCYQLLLFLVGWRTECKGRLLVRPECYDHVLPLLSNSSVTVFDYRSDGDLGPVTLFEVSVASVLAPDAPVIEQAITKLLNEGEAVIAMFDGLYMGAGSLLREDFTSYIYAFGGPLGTCVASSSEQLGSALWSEQVNELQATIGNLFGMTPDKTGSRRTDG